MFFATPHSKDGGASAPPFLWIKSKMQEPDARKMTDDR